MEWGKKENLNEIIKLKKRHLNLIFKRKRKQILTRILFFFFHYY